MNLTIAFCYHLGNCIHVLFGTTNSKLHLYDKDCNRINRLEVVFYPAFCSESTSDTSFNDRFWFMILEGKAKYSNKVVEYLKGEILSWLVVR